MSNVSCVPWRSSSEVSW